MISTLFTCVLVAAQAPDPVYRGGTVEFGGYTWELKQGSKLGPAANRWLGSNVRLTDERAVRLQIALDDRDRWACAEARVTQPLGYGEYRWTIAGDLDALDSQAVLGLFLYQGDNREIDFELSRWAGRDDTWNAQFAIMPSESDAAMLKKGRIHRFDASTNRELTVGLLWNADRVRARCWGETTTEAPPLADWTFVWPSDRNKPEPDKAHCIMNLWLIKARNPTNAKPQTIDITAFKFVPQR